MLLFGELCLWIYIFVQFWNVRVPYGRENPNQAKLLQKLSMKYFILSISVHNLAAVSKPGALERGLAVLRSGALALPAQEHPPRQLCPGTPRHNPPPRALPAGHPHTSISTKHHSLRKRTKAGLSVNSCPAPLLTPVSIPSVWPSWTTI